MTFIVRVSLDPAGQLRGLVTRVQTGAKERFEGIEALGAVIAGMAGGPATTGLADLERRERT